MQYNYIQHHTTATLQHHAIIDKTVHVYYNKIILALAMTGIEPGQYVMECRQ